MTPSSTISASKPSARRVCRGVEQWFPDAARAFPWRSNRTPWRSLVSEIMLQQTQASRIADVFEAFMAKFPTPKAMADAGEDAVVEAWKGLGFYRRARSLYKAACVLDESFGGEVPSDVATLRTIPGIGRYTAGAIASMVYGLREPIVDGNIIRVVARLDLIDKTMGDRDLERTVWARAEDFVRLADDPAVLNEGLMELGARLCTPRTPSCGACPVQRLCRAKREGRASDVPRPRVRTTRRVVVHHAVALERNGQWLLVQRPPSGHWAGMWELPSVESDGVLSDEAFAEQLPMGIREVRLVETFTHLLSHREIHFRIYTGRTRQRKGAWRSPEIVENCAMSSAMRRAIQRVVAAHEDAKRAGSEAAGSSCDG